MAAGRIDLDDQVREYARHVVGCASGTVAVTRFQSGDRHAVYRVSSRDGTGGGKDVVVRVSLHDDPAERRQAELEAAVLETLQGIGGPRLYDFRSESPWFASPVMCMELVPGEQRDLGAAPPEDLERLGAVVAAVHDRPADDLASRFPTARTLNDYVEERLQVNAAYLAAFGDRLPRAVHARVERAFSLVATSREHASQAGWSSSDDGLVLLHGDVASANILWSPEPVLIDWEYARLGDPADEVAYIFGQHGLTAAQRAAFLAGYRSATTRPRLDAVVERARWWEPVLMLGSALWWLERWSRRAEADAAAGVDPSVPKPAAYYLDHATRRLDRFDEASERD